MSASMKSFLSLCRSGSMSTTLRMTSSGSAAKSNFILEYAYVADILEKRTPFRPAHIKLAEDYHKEGTIISGGPLTPPTGAIFIFSAEQKDIVETFVRKDPYVTAGLVTSYSIREWNVVIGSKKC